MGDIDKAVSESIKKRLQTLAVESAVDFTLHALEELANEDYLARDVLAGITSGDIIENYPDHKRGACCLINGRTDSGRPIHVVCTTGTTCVIIITVYEPSPPKWRTPTERGH